jgi:hypothetical protein
MINMMWMVLSHNIYLRRGVERRKNKENSSPASAIPVAIMKASLMP